jgi:hypothetical protein
MLNAPVEGEISEIVARLLAACGCVDSVGEMQPECNPTAWYRVALVGIRQHDLLPKLMQDMTERYSVPLLGT